MKKEISMSPLRAVFLSTRQYSFLEIFENLRRLRLCYFDFYYYNYIISIPSLFIESNSNQYLSALQTFRSTLLASQPQVKTAFIEHKSPRVTWWEHRTGCVSRATSLQRGVTEHSQPPAHQCLLKAWDSWRRNFQVTSGVPPVTKPAVCSAVSRRSLCLSRREKAGSLPVETGK